MNTTMTTTLPTTGQFVMINSYEGAIYGDTYRYNEGVLEILIPTLEGSWSVVEDFEDMHADITILGYVTAEA